MSEMAQHWTKVQLREEAEGHRLHVAPDTLNQWIGDGLLPPPVKVPINTTRRKRGRPALQYDQRALNAVLWLATHRSAIDGSEAARFWMWLEGFDYIAVNPGAVLRDRIERLWRRAQQEAMPHLPDLATVAAHGLSADISEMLLDELEERMTGPMFATGQWNDQQTTLGSLAAILFSIYPPDWLRTPSATDEYEEATPAGDIAASILTPEALASRRYHKMLAEALPRLVEAGQLIRLYRMVSSPEFRPEGLRTGWQVFTADSVPMFWPAFSMILPFHTSGMDRPQDRADLMRLMRYDPFNFLLFAAAFVEAVDAVASVAPAATPTTTTVVKSQETPTTA